MINMKNSAESMRDVIRCHFDIAWKLLEFHLASIDDGRAPEFVAEVGVEKVKHGFSLDYDLKMLSIEGSSLKVIFDVVTA